MNPLPHNTDCIGSTSGTADFRAVERTEHGNIKVADTGEHGPAGPSDAQGSATDRCASGCAKAIAFALLGFGRECGANCGEHILSVSRMSVH